ncbi:MAG: hypothetical protein JXR76_10645 [Deltaproteobacteria bacterium]|nr:hypothetical protein [Deltaproteobacteria bacterium]
MLHQQNKNSDKNRLNHSARAVFCNSVLSAFIYLFVIFGITACDYMDDTVPEFADNLLHGNCVESDTSVNENCDIENRIEVGLYVIDEEHVTGINMEGFPQEVHAAAVYRVEDNLITHMRLYTQ